MTTNSYAYAVTVNCRKRIGGVVHADSMEDAVKRAAKSCKLTTRRHEPVIRPQDGAVIDRADWELDGKRAALYVYAPAERFTQ